MRSDLPADRRATMARLAYFAVILIATLSDLHFDPSLADVHARLVRAFEVRLQLRDVVDGARNVLLFAGLGGVWVVTARPGRERRSILVVTLLSLAASTCVEAMQLFSPVRDSSIVDVTTNTLGGLLGALGTVGALRLVAARRGKRSYVGVPAVIFTACYGVATCMEAFFPLLRQNLLPNLGGSPLARVMQGLRAMQERSAGVVPLTDALLFFPAGFLAAAALAEGGVSLRRAWPMVTATAAVLFGTIEVVHSVAGEPIIIGAAITHTAAGALGAVAAALTLPGFSRHVHGRDRPALLFAAYALTIMVWSWRPFRLDLSARSMAEQFTAIHLVPLMALSARFDLFTVTDIIAQFLLFVPVGALLAVWPLRRAGWLAGLLPAVFLSAALEFGKIFVADRFLDVTHILIQCAGAGIGWVIVRRAGFQPYGTLGGAAADPR